MPFKLTKIGTKLLVTFMVLSIIPFTIIGVLFFIYSDKAMSSIAFGQLTSIREVKKAQMEDFFAAQENNICFLVETVASLEQAAFSKLNTVQENKKAQINQYFQKSLSDITVISKNSTVIRALTDFSSVMDNHGGFDVDLYTLFEQVKYRNSLDQFKHEYGYDDLMIINTSGDVVFSLNREPDLGQNLMTGALKDSGLATCFKLAQTKINLQDFEPYLPSKGRQIAFLGAPIKDKNQETAGVVILKINPLAINVIAQRRQGMGKTGETFILGNVRGEPTYRSDRIIGIGKTGEKANDSYVKKVIGAADGPGIKSNISGKMKIVQYDPLQIQGLDWGLATTMDLEEAIAPQTSTDEDYFKHYIKVYGFSDLLLVSPEGDVFYSAAHNDDYGTNILAGSYADSGLANIFRRVMESKSFEIVDFEPYAPSFGEPCAFVAKPVLAENRVELVVVLRRSFDRINSIMQERTGFGTSGETYLVGPDKLLRSNTYLDSATHSTKASFANPNTGRIDTLASREALAGRTGKKIILNYKGFKVLSAYTPLKVGDKTWALIAEVSREEAFSVLHQVKLLAIFFIVFSIAVMAVISLYMARQFTKPIALLTKGAQQVKNRDFDISVNVKTNDELEFLSDTFNAMVTEIRVYSCELEQKVDQLKKADAELRKSNALLNAVMEGTPDAVYVKDLNGRYLMANATICKILERSLEEVLGKKADELFPPETARVIQHTDAMVLKNGKPIQTEQKITISNSDSYWLANKSPYRDKEGNIIGLFGISHDITRQKIAEKENADLEAKLRQSHKMEAVGTLAGGIAHDFNNILAAILGYSELIYDELAEHSDEKQYVKELINAGFRAKKLVKQILAFSRKSEQDRSPVQMAPLLKEALQLLRASIPATIEIKSQIHKDCGNIFADATQIHQVIMNICTNAAQAMDESGGVMTIILDCRELSKDFIIDEPQFKPGRYVRFCVHDTGSGIDEKIRERIFDPYFTTKQVGRGSGMGLAVVHGIVKSHDGFIAVESSPGRGTRFNVYFPIVELPPTLIPETAKQPSVGTEKILVVDDETAMIDITRRRLELLGYKVTAVDSSLAALEMFKQRPHDFDLVITDQTMPKMSGQTLAAEMMGLRKDIPIILCTGYSSKMDATSARKVGIKAFLMKPVDTKELAETIRKVLDGKPL